MAPSSPSASRTTRATADTADLTLLEAVLARDRVVVVSGLVFVIVAAWIWIALGAGTDTEAMHDNQMQMPGGVMMGAMTPATWTAGYAALIFSMWWTMMVAMMLPSATPTLLLFARINRKEKVGGRPYVPTAIFAGGYMTIWGIFSAIAAAIQWSLEQLGFLSSMMVSTSVWLGGAILIAAGIWQLTPIKTACLRHCRSPMSFLAGRWRPGRTGAFRMGLEHGVYCLGCCWFLMGLLFFGGIMNLYWIAGLALFVLMEKTIPMAHWLSRIAGAGLVAWGVLLLTHAS
jgi:predicted metal-binding membrane protein